MTAQRWDKFYDRADHLYGYEPNDFLVQQARLIRPGSRILCLGDGEGRNGVWLARQGHRVTTVDLSSVAVAKARSFAEHHGVELDAWCGDVATWIRTEAAAGPWDVVVSIFCHLPADVRQQVASDVTSLMSTKGLLIMEAYTPAQLVLGTGGPRDDELLMTREKVYAEWSSWHLEVKLIERFISEGEAHSGLSSVIQVLGQMTSW